ncbi:ATP-binding cassette domain-containing protein [Actinomadura sp. ATCC 31491]|uniref:ATP-binding cassette domain-containing protein n=1 Tax=Actinomadura luzonensis TaxID=2805427 RepID=A0ABT0G2E1_9ACTN|nr:ATP-binding cassette domain-containing protein [Actinomadura luzonensis]MCK2218784.1 ATP-binding cassette domain-containing protein [Actinomadura luzonensis]
MTADGELVRPYWRLDEPETDLGLRRMIGRLPATAGAVLAVVARASPRHAALVLALEVVSAAATACGLLATAGALERLLSADLVTALPAMGLVAGAYALRGAVGAATAAAHARVPPAVRRVAEGELFAAALRVELAAFDDPDFFDRMQRARDRALFHLGRAVDNAVELVSAALAVGAALVAVAVLHPALLAVLLVVVLPSGWSVQRSTRLAYRFMTRTVTLNRRVRMLTDLAMGREPAAEIRACQAEGFLLREYGAVADALRDQEVGVAVAQVRVRAAGRALSGLGTGLTFAALGGLLQAGWIPLAVAGAAVMAVRTGSASLSRLVLAANQLLEQGLYVRDYQRFVAESRTRTAAGGTRPAPARPELVEVRDVCFRYPGGDRPALRGVSLTARAGRTVALVGENGSGKSTLAKILAGLYAPGRGSVRWDGVDLAELDPRDVADRITLVPQAPVRWPHTARVNVRAGRHDRPDPGDLALEAAARLSGADAVVAGLPSGWETLLSKAFHGGHELSGGQWQRLAIARGLFRDTPLIVWDEPAAPLDPRAEFALYESLRGLAAGRVVVLITHRLASARNADHIYLLHEGVVAEHGSHDELIAAGGRYAELYGLQARMYAPA